MFGKDTYDLMDYFDEIRAQRTRPSISYSEIKKLDAMLSINNIPHEFYSDDFGAQITYARDGRWVLRKDGCGDVVINNGSFGHSEGLLEAMGFDITEEEYGDEVVGWLTAEQAFEFFKRQYEKDKLTRSDEGSNH